MDLRKAVLILLATGLGTCNQAIRVAPPGSTFAENKLFANPSFIAAHGDVSVISGLLLEPDGQPVVDGTVVQFFTDLGRVDEQGKTNDGVVRVNLVSDSRSGTATVTAVSGGGSSAAPTPAPSGMSERGAVVGFSVTSPTGPSAVTATEVSATVQVVIGSARPTRLLLSANPPRITSSRSTTILAEVFDTNGNPVANVPVIFTIEGSPSTERFLSGGQPVFTDNDGRADDVLRTSYDPALAAKTVTVRATTANGVTATALVTIN
jgi:hypothetical protein